jgi:hypothetical protein
MDTRADLGSDGDGDGDSRNPAPTNPAAMEEPRVTAAAAAPSLDGPDALPAPNQVRSHLLTAPPQRLWVQLDGFAALTNPRPDFFLKICGI